MPQMGMILMIAGSVAQAQGAAKAAQDEIALHKYNAALDRREAQQRRTASLDEQRIRRDQLRKPLKRQRARIAKAGIQLGGSALQVQLETIEIMAADIANYAYTRELQAVGLEARAGVSLYKAGAAREAGRIATATALVGGVSTISKMGIKRYMEKQPTTTTKKKKEPYWKV